MPIELVDFEKKARVAVKLFWRSREKARKKQAATGKRDQGERAGVTAGKNMDGFVSLVTELVHTNGLNKAEVMVKRKVLTLPGFFRPTKFWDLLVLNEGRLIAALEFKSQVGPSFGNNANNRTEEAIGTGHDLQTAYREGAFGEIPKPFVGFLFLLEDAPKSRAPVKVNSPHFPIFSEFKDASYADRYHLLCKKLMQENLYSAACLIISSRSDAKTGNYCEIAPLTGLEMFVTELAGHIAAEAARTTKKVKG